MDKRQVKKEYLRSIQPMGIVQVKNLKDGRGLLMRSANTSGTINSLRFQLNSGAFPTSQELLRDWRELGEASFTIEVIDELEATDDPARDYDAELRALEELWLERLQPYGELGYHSRKRTPQS
jgi:hypothetical protein